MGSAPLPLPEKKKNSTEKENSTEKSEIMVYTLYHDVHILS